MKNKLKTFKLGSIADEAALCRKAFMKVKADVFSLHCHHEILGEFLTEDPENRILYILLAKPEHEQALRLRLFRPVSTTQLRKFKKANADWQKAYEDWKKAYEDWKKAYEDRQKANMDWQKAYEDWQKANMDWKKADEDRQKENMDWQKVYEDWQKANMDWKKADADWKKADADWQKAKQKAYEDVPVLIHDKVCYSNCPWNGKTIFSKS